MHIQITVDEALRLVTAKEPLPALVRSVRADGDAVVVEVEPRLLPELSGAMRFAASLAGVVPVVARFVGFEDGVARFGLDVTAHGLPAHRLVSALAGTITTQISRKGFPTGAVEIHRTDGAPELAVAIQSFVEPLVGGVTVIGFALRDATIHVELAVGDVVLR